MATSGSGQSSIGATSVIDYIATSPFEIAASILSQLDNRDLKSLRLTNKRLAGVIAPHLRFERVFISANTLDVAVFRAIAGHETFRHRVLEIVWDDARYEKPPPPDPRIGDEWDFYYEDYVEEEDEEKDESERPKWPPAPGVPFWFFKQCEDNIEYLEYRRQDDVETLPQHLDATKQLEAQLPLDVAYAHYVELLTQQDEVLSTSADLAAFDWALENNRFPNLRRVNLTPAAHGLLFKPLYPTPTIRALPYGFIYPLPRGWPAAKDDNRGPDANWDLEGWKERWRGLLHVLSSLARQDDTKIQELIVGGTEVWSGLTCGLFCASEPCVEYDNLVSVIKKSGFTTLRLSIMATAQDNRNYLGFRTGRLRKALEADLRHFSFETDEEGSHEHTSYPSHWVLDHFIPLRSIFPVEAWKNLAHFGLSRFLVKQQDLLDFLAALPQTLRSVELSFIWFMKGNGNYRKLLFGIRDELGWQKRAARPYLLIRDAPGTDMKGRAIWLENEVDQFLYQGGENPYKVSRSWSPQEFPDGAIIRSGMGTVKDAFEPQFERPNVSAVELMGLGIHKDLGPEYLEISRAFEARLAANNDIHGGN
ncbi:hypothetical protein CPLU01_08925 [Colletotrichum plurivorum]|uniref:F-box domain-containing protein n=1 Tax=Colletotrichum plurivorum TaxID=2175906 RepID=A0A8H6NCN9_9PEZI|nr:hypothetical protein CPLU01_08925 [Colletotrichum plurivorum]